MQLSISDVGISVAYEPKDCAPILDIVLVHGLQGHPYKTWAAHPEESEDGKTGRKKFIRRITGLAKRSSKNHSTEIQTAQFAVESGETSNSQSTPVFWPTDLLPERCPRARILLYGYDSKITKYMSGSPNQNNIYSHGKDLLFALGRARCLDRPVLFVAHSLGGVVVKEMLARSSTSDDPTLKNVVNFTAAIIFLGTPHRGSPGLAALGQFARTIVSGLRMKTTSAILDSLGMKNTDLERSQEAFSALWQRYDFKVKTFQEGLGLSGVNLGALGNKVVPDFSSLIGDYRERAETLQANHRNMCRFAGADDPNYRKVAGELESMYQSTLKTKLNAKSAPRRLYLTISSSTSSTDLNLDDLDDLDVTAEISPQEKAYLQALYFPDMNYRRETLGQPADQTCSWLFEHEIYRNWSNTQEGNESAGLIWLKGKPGAGKSILMREAFYKTQAQHSGSDHCVVSFFFNAKGDDLQCSPEGLLRSLLYQLLPRHRRMLRKISSKSRSSDSLLPRGGFLQANLHAITSEVLLQPSAKTTIFIDGLDECKNKLRNEIYFWRRLTKRAYSTGIYLKVCLSSRHFPNITISNCPNILVEHHNYDDLSRYVEQKFRLSIADAEPNWGMLGREILLRSDGVFLWVVLTVDRLLKRWDEGAKLELLLEELFSVPQSLGYLFKQMLGHIDPETKELTRRFFEWVILSVKPLRLYEWHDIMGFIRNPTPSSLGEWRTSNHAPKNDHRLERQIRSISRGLVEIKTWKIDVGTHGNELEAVSICAGAGSLDLDYGESRVVDVIHETVRQFFLNDTGFQDLGGCGKKAVGNGHISIMATCLDYIQITELDALVSARERIRERKPLRDLDKLPKSLQKPSLKQVSSKGSLSPSFKSLKMSPSPEYGEQILDTNSPFDALIGSRGTTLGMGVYQWVMSSQHDTETVSIDRFSKSIDMSDNSSMLFGSDAVRSEVLETYPALLSYVTAHLFTHARLAEGCSGNPTDIIERLERFEIWSRWQALREDVPKKMDVFQYAASQGLKTWGVQSEDEGNALSRFWYPERKDVYADVYMEPGRRGSVESFGSASSHGTGPF